MLVPRGIQFLVWFWVFIWNVSKGEYFSNLSEYNELSIHFKTFHIKTKNNTKNHIPPVTYITNEARNH